MYRKTYVEINVNNLKNNVKNIISNYNNYDYYIGVVKGNAYGHGNYTAKYLVESGINYLAVSSLEEALDIRNNIKEIPILCLEPIDLNYIDICINNNITVTLSDYDYYKELIKKDINNLKIHLKIDSGMNRLGFNNKEKIKEVFDNLINTNIEGIYTHFGTTGINDKKFDNQVTKFLLLTSLIDLKKIKIVHCGRSTTLINHKKLEFTNGIRLGIIMYGINLSSPINKGIKNILRNIKNNLKKYKLNISKTNTVCPIEIKNTFKLVSEIIEIKDINKGDSVGYGFSYIAEKNTKIGVVPVGYADGLPLSSANRFVSINNNKYKIVGSINMGMITIEIDSNIKLHDRVEVIDENIKKIALHTNNTVYTVMTQINPLLPRVYIENEKILKIVE